MCMHFKCADEIPLDGRVLKSILAPLLNTFEFLVGLVTKGNLITRRLYGLIAVYCVWPSVPCLM